MDRFVILVDAGYLFAAAGDLCHGTSFRRDLLLDPIKVTSALVDLCQKHSGQKYLRTYWYDAAVDALPTPEHNRLADQRGLKLRLGRMVHGGQKGVDSRIVRDLIVLPRNGAVGTIYLMSGDEDVREGVVEAQELGVSVVLIGVEAPVGRRNQAQTLVREADDHIILPRSECERFLADARPAVAAAAIALPAAPAPTAGASGAPAAPAPAASVTLGATGRAIARADGELFGAQYAANWKASNDASSLATLMRSKPNIPITVDGPLMRSAKTHFGVELHDSDRRAIRTGFWRGLVRI
jgi:uncharacterized LabA/DUF88 family protein